MERLIRYGSITNDPLYNCSARTPKMIEMNIFEPEIHYGTCSFVFGVVSEILFILCVKVMLEPTNFVCTAYKIMVVISFCDMCGTVYSCITYGFIYYYGIVFCDYPNTLYVVGLFASSAWITTSLLSSILIMNRFVELNSPKNKLWTDIFNGKYTPILMCIPVSIGLYCLSCELPVLLDLNSGVDLWDPQIYENASSQYFGHMLVYNNTILLSCNSTLSIILCINITKHLEKNFGSMIDRRRQFMLFCQCLATVTISNMAASLHVFNFFFECPAIIQKFTGLLYQLATSLPPFAYIILNRAIRQGIYKLCLEYNPKQYFTMTSKPISRRLQATSHALPSHISTITRYNTVSPNKYT